jgi:hypothetical protein
VNLPLWVRKAIVDFVETALAFILVQMTFTGNAEVDARTLVIGVFGAFVSAIRRRKDDIVDWVKSGLGVE